MLETRSNHKNTFYSFDAPLMAPTKSLVDYYEGLHRPELGIPSRVIPEKGGFVRTHKEYIRADWEKLRDRWNPCEHYKCYIDPDDAFPSHYLWPALTFSGNGAWEGLGKTKNLVTMVPDYLNPSLGSGPLYVLREDGGFVPPPPDIDGLKQRSLNAMLPTVKSNLSLVNSVYELKDFRSLPRTLRKIRDTSYRIDALLRQLPKFFRNMANGPVRRSFNREAGRTLREATRTGADGYLQTQFNILPLLKDITGIYTSIVQLNKVITDLVKRQGSPQRRHFTFRWETTKVDPFDEIVDIYDDTIYHTVGDEILYGGPAYGVVLTSSVPSKTATFHAEIEYNYHFTRYQVENAQLLGFMDALGLNLNPAIIWNAIPWSFIVDWVAGVNRWLDNRKVLQLEPVVNITRYLWSWKHVREVKRSMKSFATAFGTYPPITIYNLPRVYESVYRRDVGLPQTSSIMLSGLSPKEFSLGLALAITRRRSRHNRGR